MLDKKAQKLTKSIVKQIKRCYNKQRGMYEKDNNINSYFNSSVNGISL